MITKKKIILILILSGLLGLGLSLYLHKDIFKSNDNPLILSDAITISQTTHKPVSFVKQLIGDKDAGRKIFREYCASCHDQEPIIDVQAPLIGDKKEWQHRLRRGYPALVKTTLEGKGTMPTRGGCFECSDDQLQMAIRYLLDKSK